MSISIEDLAHEISWLKNNYKQYVAGQTYNGAALTVTPTAGSVGSAFFIPHKTVDGTPLLDGRIWITGLNNGFVYMDITGFEFDSPSGKFQHVGCCIYPDTNWSLANLRTGTVNMIVTYHAILASELYISFNNAKIKLWPTWADVV